MKWAECNDGKTVLVIDGEPFMQADYVPIGAVVEGLRGDDD